MPWRNNQPSPRRHDWRLSANGLLIAMLLTSFAIGCSANFSELRKPEQVALKDSFRGTASLTTKVSHYGADSANELRVQVAQTVSSVKMMTSSPMMS
jgi:hypothetical protein